MIGFWGTPTSSVDWCEANYAFTPYVAEMFNTLSSVALMVAGAVGAWIHRRTLRPAFLTAFAGVALVGVGSIAFHATLRFELQMLDELPMLYLVSLMAYLLVPQKRLGPALVVYAALATYLCAFTRGRLQFWFFQVGFGWLEIFSLWSVYRLNRASSNPALHRLFRRGMAAYALAVACWFIDIRFCTWLSWNPQLHAGWHVLVAYGFYTLFLVVAHEDILRHGQTPKIDFRFGVFPRLETRSEVGQ